MRYYSVDKAMTMNYGSMGGVIGHEVCFCMNVKMTHAFDSFGSQFNGQGERKPWMSLQSQKEFNRQAQCFVQQYIPVLKMEPR